MRTLPARRLQRLAGLVGVVLGGAGWVAFPAGASGAPAGAPLAPAGLAAQTHAPAELDALPLSFAVNRGQFARGVRFAADSSGLGLALTDDGALVSLGRRHAAGLGIRFIGGRASRPSGTDRLPGVSNYLVGPKSRWRTDVPTFARVRYRQVWPGVDASFSGGGGRLALDFDVAPEVSARRVQVGFTRARFVRLRSGGGLVLGLRGGGTVRVLPPRSYQQVAGRRVAVPSSFVLLGRNRVGVSLGRRDRARGVVVDPDLSYSTFVGGSGAPTSTPDLGSVQAIAVDQHGDAYFTGGTGDDLFPKTGTAGPPGSGSEVFVSKLNASGSALVYSTYIGGTHPDYGAGIAVDSTGSAYVTGTTGTSTGSATASNDFPTTPGAFQPNDGGAADPFALKLSPDGSTLVYSTYIGGPGNGSGEGIAIDHAGDAYLTGTTASTNFPIMGGFQSTGGGTNAEDAFVAEVNPSGTDLVYSSYLGGSASDHGTAIAVRGGEAYVTGYTNSPDFHTIPGAYDTAPGGEYDAFVAEVAAGGGSLVYSTLLGSSDEDYGRAIAVDQAGDVYVAGETQGGSMTNPFPTTAGAFQTGHTGYAGFVAKLNPTSSAANQLVYSTFLGGMGTDNATAIALDPAGHAWVAGITNSPDFPTTADAPQPIYGGGSDDAFVTELNPTTATGTPADQLLFSTFLGGSGADSAASIAVHAGEAYVTGVAGAPASTRAAGDFPTTACAYQPVFGGGSSDVFVTKLGAGPAPNVTISKTASPAQVAPGGKVTYTLEVHSECSQPLTGVTVTDDLSGVLGKASLDGQPSVEGGGTATVQHQQLQWTGSLDAQATVRITYSVTVDQDAAGLLYNRAAGTASWQCTGLDPTQPCMTETEIVPPPPAPSPPGGGASPGAGGQGGGASPGAGGQGGGQPAQPAPPDLVVGKTASRSTVSPGGQVTYQVSVHNNGHGTATGVMLLDPAPSGESFTRVTPSQGTCTTGSVLRCTLGSLPAAGAVVVQVVARVAANARGTLTNQASAWSAADDANPGDNSASVAVRVVPAASAGGNAHRRPSGSPASSDLVVTKRVDRSRAQRGTRLRYTVTVTNRGPDAARHVRLTDSTRLPLRDVSVHAGQGTCTASIPVSCQLGRLAVGRRVTVTITGIAAVAGRLVASAASASENRDPHPGTAVAHAATDVIPILDLDLRASRHTIHVGRDTVLRLVVDNPNGLALHHVRTCVKIPSGLAYRGSEPEAAGFGGGLRRCWTEATLADGHSATYHLILRGLPRAVGDPVIHATAVAAAANTAHGRTHITVLAAPAAAGPPPRVTG